MVAVGAAVLPQGIALIGRQLIEAYCFAVVFREATATVLVEVTEVGLPFGIALIGRQLIEACRLSVILRGQCRRRCNRDLLWSVELERWRFMLLQFVNPRPSQLGEGVLVAIDEGLEQSNVCCVFGSIPRLGDFT